MMSERTSKSVLERNKFFATTNIAGFGWIQNSNSKFETILWYIVIAIFFGLTVRNVVSITMEYSNQVPIATVTLNAWDGDMSHILFRIPINFPEFYGEFYDNSTIYPFPYLYNRSLEADLDDALAEMDTKEKVLGSNSWPYVLLNLIARLANLLNKLEHMYVAVDLNQTVGIFEMGKQGPYVQRVVDNFERLNVSNREMIDQWFIQILKMISYKGFGVSEKSGAVDVDQRQMQTLVTVMTQRSNLTGITQYTITVGFKTKFFLEESVEWDLNYNSFVTVMLNSDVLGDNITWDDTVEWYMESFHEPASISVIDNHPKHGPFFHIAFGYFSGFQVKADYSFEAISKCSKTISQRECYVNCRNRLIVEACQCNSLFWINHNVTYSNVQSCSMQIYMKCRSTDDLDHGHLYCMNGCPEHCMQTVLSFEKAMDMKLDSKIDLGFRLINAMIKYPAFQEIYQQSAMSYWAALGGISDFWIGASVISGVHVMVYVAKQIIYSFRGKTESDGNIANREGSTMVKIQELTCIDRRLDNDKTTNIDQSLTTRICQLEAELRQLKHRFEQEKE